MLLAAAGVGPTGGRAEGRATLTAVSVDPLTVFVYGTLRRGHPAHDAHLAGRIVGVWPARMAGLALHHGPGYPFATETGASPTDVAVGEVVELDPRRAVETMAGLDWWEDIDPVAPDRGLYVRVVRTAHLESGASRPAWVYLAGPGVALDPTTRIAGGEWRP